MFFYEDPREKSLLFSEAGKIIFFTEWLGRFSLSGSMTSFGHKKLWDQHWRVEGGITIKMDHLLCIWMNTKPQVLGTEFWWLSVSLFIVGGLKKNHIRWNMVILPYPRKTVISSVPICWSGGRNILITLCAYILLGFIQMHSYCFCIDMEKLYSSVADHDSRI